MPPRSRDDSAGWSGPGVMAALSDFDVAWTAAPDAGVLTVLSTRGNDAYGMISGPRTVSVLAELGYISNPAEAELFATSDYVDAMSDALAAASVDNYLTTEATGAGGAGGVTPWATVRGLQVFQSTAPGGRCVRGVHRDRRGAERAWRAQRHRRVGAHRTSSARHRPDISEGHGTSPSGRRRRLRHAPEVRHPQHPHLRRWGGPWSIQ